MFLQEKYLQLKAPKYVYITGCRNSCSYNPMEIDKRLNITLIPHQPEAQKGIIVGFVSQGGFIKNK